jgi:nicotinamidase-related amidase
MLLNARRSTLLVVDIQGALLPSMADVAGVVRGAGILMRAAGRLGVPMVVSEQYPRGLGPTVREVAELAPPNSVFEKLHFSCFDDPAISTHLRELDRPQVVVAGIEAHICVLQTALSLKMAGFEPLVVADATSSRSAANHQAAMARLAAAGVIIGTVEMVVFEWLNRADTAEFRELVKLIK